MKSATPRSTGSPSARAREQVRGSWDYNMNPNSPQELFIHSIKQVIGTPIPWLILCLPVAIASSNLLTEIISWTLGLLVLSYIAIDSFAQDREFHFFRIGPDITLGFNAIIGIISVIVSLFSVGLGSSDGPMSLSSEVLRLFTSGMGYLRWILLTYLFVYTLELFPGINRLFKVFAGAIAGLTILAWIQHFQGYNWFTSTALNRIPLGDIPLFMPIGLSHSPESLATLLACFLPFPVAAVCLRPDTSEISRLVWVCAALTVLVANALLFTYLPEFWWAGLTGVVAVLIFPSERRLKSFFALLGSTFVVWAAVTFTGSLFAHQAEWSILHPSTLVENMKSAQAAREVPHRKTMNELADAWEKAPLLGSSAMIDSILTDNTKDHTNIYFILLARVGLLGLIAYLAFILHLLLSILRLFKEIPESHHKHRLIVAGCFASQCAFHIVGLFSNTLGNSFSMVIFILSSAICLYMTEHYALGLVPDDNSL